MFELTNNAISTADCVSRLGDARAGALVSFEGRVRNHHLGKAVVALEYEAAPVLAQCEFAKIIAEVMRDTPVLDVLCMHRIGRMEVGETAIWLGVLAPHRAEAFAFCERVMSELKLRLPIWKKEHFADGISNWVDDPCGCVHRS